MQAWNYRELLTILEGKAEELNVSVSRLSPTYTSQRCSKCGYTKKSNRTGKQFRCASCGYTADADLNAACNLASPLRTIQYRDRLKLNNRTGFYWLAEGQESIVPDVAKHVIIYQ